jgi:exonuclease VII small subunit
MNGFAKYKQNLDTILENSYGNKKDFKKNLSVIMGAMKFSKTLKEFFTLYNEIESKKFDSLEDSKLYITEATQYLKKNKKELNKVKNILDKIINDRKDACSNEPNRIYEEIDNIVFNTNIKTIDSKIQSNKVLVESMVNKKTKKSIDKPINPKVLSHVMSKNYEKEFGTKLTESEKDILQNTLLMTEDTVTKEFNNVKNVALTTLNKLLSESNDENISAKLVEVKNEINTLKSSKHSYIRVRGLLEDLN